MDGRQDRRTHKTRQQLRGALLALLKEKRYNEISVQDIIERADVARSTFYMHYVDKDDLLTGDRGIFAENLDHQRAGHSDASAFSARLWFEHVQSQGDILKVIARDPAMELAMKTLRGIIHRSVREGMQSHSQVANAGVPLPVIVDFVSDSLMSLIHGWVQDGMKREPEQMDNMFRQLVLPGVTSVLRGEKDETR